MRPQKTNVYLRADGNNKIGLGHVHRLLALSEILADNFKCQFIIKSPLTGVRELILKSCAGIVEIGDEAIRPDEISKFLSGGEIVVLDGYKFDTTYQQSVKQRGATLVCIDDIHQYHFVSDVIINPAGGLDETVYSKEVNTKLFSGPKFSLLKRPFLEAAQNKLTRVTTNSIFICMGGADPDDHTLATLKHCLNFPFATFFIVIGEAYVHKDRLNEEVKKMDRDINVLINVKPEILVSTMKQCDVAVCAASGIAYEYISVGGELYLKQTASNQNHLFTYLISDNLAFNFDNFRVSPNIAATVLQKQKEIFDGNSGKRILKIFNELDFDLNATMRYAATSDVLIIYQWANESELRAQSFNPEPIPWENHVTWFNRKMGDPTTIFFIFEYKNSPIGQVRFDIGLEAIISYSIDRDFRGRGWGQWMLQKAIGRLREKRHPIKIIGYVKQENTSSNRIFKNLGFVQSKSSENPNAYKYELIKL